MAKDRRARFEGINSPRISIDEAQEFLGMHPSVQARQRGWGDDWDNTPGGVILRPIPLGTLVEFFDMACDQVMLGRVIARVTTSPLTAYEIETPNTRHRVGREHVAIFDQSPEGIEAFLEGPRDVADMTPEEVERWLGDA